jgi:hypothetical protein
MGSRQNPTEIIYRFFNTLVKVSLKIMGYVYSLSF